MCGARVEASSIAANAHEWEHRAGPDLLAALEAVRDSGYLAHGPMCDVGACVCWMGDALAAIDKARNRA
jgi:hypothetical protein